MQTFKMNNDGDIMFDSNNILLMTYEKDVYIQALQMLLSTRKGEYFLNNQEGLDFNPFFGSKTFSEDEITLALQDVGEQIRDFVKYTLIDYEFNDKTRKLKIKLEALYEDNSSEIIIEEVVL